MATRNLAEKTIKAEECTSFQLHKSQRAVFNGIRHKVFDYAEYRLRLLAERSVNVERRSFLLQLIKRYCRGEVAIAWRGGQPVWVDVTKGA